MKNRQQNRRIRLKWELKAEKTIHIYAKYKRYFLTLILIGSCQKIMHREIKYHFSHVRKQKVCYLNSCIITEIRKIPTNFRLILIQNPHTNKYAHTHTRIFPQKNRLKIKQRQSFACVFPMPAIQQLSPIPISRPVIDNKIHLFT